MLLALPLHRSLVGASSIFAGKSALAWSSTRAPLLTSRGALSLLCSARHVSNAAAGSNMACSFTVAQFPCLSDNYGYLIHHGATGHTAAIDTPEAGPYKEELKKRGWKLTHIFNTHHHHDHTGGNMELKTDGVKIFGPASEKIPGMDVGLTGGDQVDFGSTKATVMDVGGHTKGHIAYYFPDDGKAFVGDSLFALGCGRMFEGTPGQYWTSLKSLRELPDETDVFW